MERCRCHSRKAYHRCCEPLHQGRPAPDPVALMRSRYCAYARGDAAYVMETTHPAHREQDLNAWRASILVFCAHTHFVDLRVEPAEIAGEEAFVRFWATLARDGQDASFGERSRFARWEDRWTYLTGETEAARPTRG